MFASLAAIVLLAAGFFSPIQALDYVDMMEDEANFGDKSHDEEFQLAWKCTCLIICELHQIMDVKKIVEQLDNRTVLFVADKARELFPEVDVANEEFFDNEAWKKRAEKIFCSFSEEDTEKLMKIPLTEYASEVCAEHREDRRECDGLAGAAEANNEMFEKYKEECAEDNLKDVPGIK